MIGKTTLLNVLNFRNTRTLKITGDVKINGDVITSNAELSSKCENTLIGSEEKGVKGISGGEKRRLAFACEVFILF